MGVKSLCPLLVFPAGHDKVVRMGAMGVAAPMLSNLWVLAPLLFLQIYILWKSAPIAFEKSLIAPIDFDKNLIVSIYFDNFHVKMGVTKNLPPSIEIPKEAPAQYKNIIWFFLDKPQQNSLSSDANHEASNNLGKFLCK